MSLHCIIYTSISSRKLSNDKLNKYLRKLKAKYEEKNLTGIFLYLDPYIMQILEGEEELLIKLFKKINKDSRHRKIRLIYSQPIKQRLFLNWTIMSSAHENIEDSESFINVVNVPDKNFVSSASQVQQLLIMFKNETLF